MSNCVFAKTSAMVIWQGRTFLLGQGDVWDAEDPLVIGRPDFFSDEPDRLNSSLSAEERANRPPTLSTRQLKAILGSLTPDQRKKLAEKLLEKSDD